MGAPPPAQTAAPAAAAPGGGMMSGLGEAVMTGMAMGAGSAVAHSAINSVLGGSGGEKGDSGSYHEGGNENYDNVAAPYEGTQDDCHEYYQSLQQCLQMNSTDISACQ